MIELTQHNPGNVPSRETTMDPFYAFLIFAAALILEQAAAHAWLPAYFRIGVPIFYSRRAAPTLQGDCAQAAPLLKNGLESGFHGQPAHPSILFRDVQPCRLAFREAMFENRGGFRYLPVMHAALHLDPQHGEISITGFLNASVLLALVYMVYRSLVDRSFIPVAILIFIVLAISYMAQASISQRILDQASTTDLTGSARPGNHPEPENYPGSKQP